MPAKKTTTKKASKTALGHSYKKGDAFRHTKFPSLIIVVHQRVSTGVTVPTYKVKIHNSDDTLWITEEHKLNELYERVDLDELDE